MAQIEGFNPRARAGRDTPTPANENGKTRFQSTRPRRARPRRAGLLNGILGFNPRARAGRDSIQGKLFSPFNVSIHAPAQGATRNQQSVIPNFEVSIHAPAQGATTGAGRNES